MSMAYPKNLIHHNIYDHSTNGYFDRINERQTRLFQDEKSEACVDFWERDIEAKGSLNPLLHGEAFPSRLLTEIPAQLSGMSA